MNRNEKLYASFIALAVQGIKISQCVHFAIKLKDYDSFIGRMKGLHSEYMEAYNAFLRATKIKEE